MNPPPDADAVAPDVAGSGKSGVVISALAELPERTLLDERALAGVLRVTRRTVRRMVVRFELPPPVRLAGRATWQAGQVLRWFESRAERAARKAELIARRLDSD